MNAVTNVNWPHIHLMINHVPVIGVIGAILLLLYAIVRKSAEVKMLSLAAFVLIALATFAVFFTGEAAGDALKHLNLPGVTDAVVGRHEEMAELAIVLIEILGLLSLAALLILKIKGFLPTWAMIVVLVFSILTAGIVGLTANLGGQIRHTEIRSDTDSTSP